MVACLPPCPIDRAIHTLIALALCVGVCVCVPCCAAIGTFISVETATIRVDDDVHAESRASASPKAPVLVCAAFQPAPTVEFSVPSHLIGSDDGVCQRCLTLSNPTPKPLVLRVDHARLPCGYSVVGMCNESSQEMKPTSFFDNISVPPHGQTSLVLSWDPVAYARGKTHTAAQSSDENFDTSAANVCSIVARVRDTMYLQATQGSRVRLSVLLWAECVAPAPRTRRRRRSRRRSGLSLRERVLGHAKKDEDVGVEGAEQCPGPVIITTATTTNNNKKKTKSGIPSFVKRHHANGVTAFSATEAAAPQRMPLSPLPKNTNLSGPAAAAKKKTKASGTKLALARTKASANATKAKTTASKAKAKADAKANANAATSTTAFKKPRRGSTSGVSRRLRLFASTASAEDRRRSLSASPPRRARGRKASRGGDGSRRTRRSSVAARLSRLAVKGRVANSQRATLKRVLFDDRCVHAYAHCGLGAAALPRWLLLSEWCTDNCTMPCTPCPSLALPGCLFVCFFFVLLCPVLSFQVARKARGRLQGVVQPHVCAQGGRFLERRGPFSRQEQEGQQGQHHHHHHPPSPQEVCDGATHSCGCGWLGCC